jgi:hypothetical protein
MALSLIACAALSACDDDSEPVETTAPAPAEEQEAETTEDTTATAPTGAEDQAPEPETTTEEEADTAAAQPPRTTDEQEVARTVRTYLLGLDAGDGARVCATLVPGAIDEVELPEPRGDCAASLSASIGYRDPRGLPVFEGLKLAGIRSLAVEGDTARARATTVTTFSDRDEPSIEDDVVYLSRVDDRWLVAKPSSTLYRAVGIAEVPPSVLAPP